jgi:hypothetical protein
VQEAKFSDEANTCFAQSKINLVGVAETRKKYFFANRPPWLPDGLLAYQKSKFWYIINSLD